MEILKVENLVKTYGKGENQINAVDNISFTINKGEFVAIVGASGSGLLYDASPSVYGCKRRKNGARCS